MRALGAVWRARIELFWPFWLLTTVAGALLVIWVIPKRKGMISDSTPARRQDWSRTAIVAVACLALLLAIYGAGSVVWEDFAYHDESMFTTYTLVGHDIPPHIFPDQGRFFPLAHQEFNLLRHVTSSIFGYHSFRIVQLVLLTCIVLLVLLDELSIEQRVALTILTLITPSMLISFYGLIYTEANVILWIVCLAWSIKRFEQTGSRPWAIAAVISTQFLLYYKEVAPLLLLGFSFGRLLLRSRNVLQPGWDFRRLWDPQSRLDMCLAALVVPFVMFYLAAMYPSYRTPYVENLRLPLAQVFRAYSKLDLAVWVFIAVTSARIGLTLRGRATPSLLWDGLALGGVGYVAGYFHLQMYGAYYLAPADFIAVLYLGRLAFLSLEHMSDGAKAGAVALLSLVVLQDLLLSAFLVYERKNIIHAKADLGRVIEARYQSGQRDMRLFFPVAEPYWIMEFASYLNHLGVPVERLTPDSGVTGTVQMVGRSIEKDGRCRFWKDFACHAGNSPEIGDLIVVLPDDFSPAENLDSPARGGSDETLLSYSPRPPIPRWLRPYVNRLHVGLPFIAVPDRWLDASLTVRKPVR